MSSALRLPRRRFFALALAALAVPAPAAEPAGLSADDQALVERARTYLLGLSSAIGRFTQTDPHGHVTTGTFYLRRPGRARFEYDPPSGLVVASNGFRVAVLNRRLGTLDAYPLGATPLGVLLSRDIRIDRNVEVGAVKRRPGGFGIVARQASKRNEGEITLDFNDAPIALAGWAITDAQGGVTRVNLADFGLSKAMPNWYFELAPPGAGRNAPDSVKKPDAAKTPSP
jgi:outer membrane lipoprotein-sorting protein